MTKGADPVRVGIIGTGAISQVVHVPILAERDDVEVRALADIDAHKAEALSRRFDVPMVMDADELIRYDDLDAIVVSTPNHLHEEMSIAALESGKHVFVERPLASSSAGARRAVEAARTAGRLLVVGMPHRYRPEVAALRSFVAGGELGDLQAVRGSWMTRPFPAARSTWRHDRSAAGGGALVELGVPALDLLLWLVDFPRLRRLSCVLGYGDHEVEDSATIMAEGESGLAFSLHVTSRLFASEDRTFAQVLGTEGSGSLPPLEVFKQLGGRPLDVTPRQPRPQGGENPYTNAYRRLLDEFVRGAAGRSDVPLPEEQVALASLVEAAYRAAEMGTEVEL